MAVRSNSIRVESLDEHLARREKPQFKWASSVLMVSGSVEGIVRMERVTYGMMFGKSKNDLAIEAFKLAGEEIDKLKGHKTAEISINRFNDESSRLLVTRIIDCRGKQPSDITEARDLAITDIIKIAKMLDEKFSEEAIAAEQRDSQTSFQFEKHDGDQQFGGDGCGYDDGRMASTIASLRNSDLTSESWSSDNPQNYVG